jgi:hypothetical protein
MSKNYIAELWLDLFEVEWLLVQKLYYNRG